MEPITKWTPKQVVDWMRGKWGTLKRLDFSLEKKNLIDFIKREAVQRLLCPSAESLLGYLLLVS